MPPKLFDPAAQQIAQRNFRHYEQQFYISPKQLRGCLLPAKLTWNRVPFKKKQLRMITNQPGVYAFSVLHDSGNLPPHGYVLYVGQTGGKKKAQHRTLRQRAREYYREKTAGRREHVALFLNKWSKCLYFYYAQLDPTTVDLLDVESKLNDALIPPYSVADFSPKIRKSKRIAEIQ
jgi:hypothetical protein